VSNDVILLVDDNSDDVTLTVWAFRKSGIKSEIIVAGDGQAAVDLLLPTDGSVGMRPTIVLLDINMPRMSGPEALKLLRADPATKSLPVIMLTSSLDDRDIIRSYDLGANSYVQKPVGSTEFLEAAKALGVYWLGVNKQPRVRVD
jgi:two-component system, response regulator